MDCTYRLRIPHTSGQLAKVASTIAAQGGLIGDVTTISVARHEALRDITVELRDKAHAEALAAALGALPGIRVIWFHDRAFIAHDGGKLEVVARRFCGVHSQAISGPGGFGIERQLLGGLPQPVMHDDVHGTAVVTFSAAIAACRQVGKRLDEAVVGQVGLGAAGYGIATLIHDAGVRRVLGADPSPRAQEQASERGIEIADLETVMREADVVVATSGRPGLIAPETI